MAEESEDNQELADALDTVLSLIKELEEVVETKQKIIITASEVIENSIQKQVVIDVLQNNRNELLGMTYLSNEQYKLYEMQIERINKIEQELLGGEK